MFLLTILTEIISSLARAALATYLANELYSLTLPTLIPFTILTYAIITRDPLRRSLPPSLGLRGFWRALGRRKYQTIAKDGLHRLSILGKDVFFVKEEKVISALVDHEGIVEVYPGDGQFLSLTEKDKSAIDLVLSPANLSLYWGILDEEIDMFIEKIAQDKVIKVSVISQYVNTLLHRSVYGNNGPNQLLGQSNLRRPTFRSVLFRHYFPYLYRPIRKEDRTVDTVRYDKFTTSSMEVQLQAEGVQHPHNLANFIVDSASPILVNALVQIFVGLLSSTKLAHEVQIEFDKLMTSQNLNLPDIQYLSVLPAIVSEALRLSLILAPPSIYYKVDQDVWYENWFLPKSSLLVFDREDIFLENKKLADTQFRPDRYWEISPTVGEVDEIAFKYGLEQKYLVNLILLNSVATTLRKFTIARGASDGKLKFVRYAVKRK